MTRWIVQWASGRRRVVEAADQHAAWNTLRNEPLRDFGLIVTALREGDDEGDEFGVHTLALLLTWGRDAEARILADALREVLGDEVVRTDLAYAAAHGRTDPFPMPPFVREAPHAAD